MTDAPQPQHGSTHPTQEPDVLPWRTLVGVMVATTVLSVALGGWGCVLARRLGPAMEGAPPDAARPADLVRSSLDYELFDAAPAPRARARAADRRRLDRWGWVDPDRGVVHMPIDVAIRLHLQESAQETAAR